MNNSVYNFYKNQGWKKNKKHTIDSILYEDLRNVAKKYVSNTRKRVLKFLPNKGERILDFASGPIQYPEYKLYSKNFKHRYCVDFSKEAIQKARKVLKKHGKFFCNNFLNIRFKNNFFDSTISLHTIYHLKKYDQKKAINKMIDVTKKGCPIIIVYSNPKNIFYYIKKIINYKSKKGNIYFHCFENKWWYQFKKRAKIKIYPQRSFTAQHQKLLFPDNLIGKIMFEVLFKLEKLLPSFFSRYFQYNIIVLIKDN
tara:strand:- start:254 stop:1015 length:762 start_codon:yes stop_codon:yes gene_type:complete